MLIDKDKPKQQKMAHQSQIVVNSRKAQKHRKKAFSWGYAGLIRKVQ
jgi:hypothetical protein